MSSLFAAVLCVNPVQHLLAARGALSSLPAASQRVLTGRQFFPELISGSLHHGLSVVFSVAAALAAVAAFASLLRGGRYIHPEAADEVPLPAGGKPPHAAPRPPGAGRPPARDNQIDSQRISGAGLASG